MRQQLLGPFRDGPGASDRTAVFDEPSDQPIDTPTRKITGDEILLLSCSSTASSCAGLNRAWCQDIVILLDGQTRVNLTRLGHVLSDAPTEPTELVGHVLEWVERLDRYTSGMRFYLDSDDPVGRADFVIDNNDLASPANAAPTNPPVGNSLISA